MDVGEQDGVADFVGGREPDGKDVNVHDPLNANVVAELMARAFGWKLKLAE